MKDVDDITGAIVDAALRVHRDLAPGLPPALPRLRVNQAVAAMNRESSA